MTEQSLSWFEQKAEVWARHRALILQILNKHPQGLTTQQILQVALDWFGYTFLTDNRLRELRQSGLVESVDRKEEGLPLLWRVIPDSE